ncbi:MAG: AI-2E family transporter [Neisseriaceae bacterium]|nr:AI-2E family transporter [Neisseriaceae bacterium]
MPDQNAPFLEARKLIIASYILAAFTLFAILKFHLLSALFAGLLVYELTVLIATRSIVAKLGRPRARFVSMSLLAMLIVSAFVGIGVGIMSIFYGEHNAIPSVMQKAAEIATTIYGYLPSWLSNVLPQSPEEWQISVMDYLKEHADQLQLFGGRAGRSMVHILFGMVIGALVALYSLTQPKKLGLLPRVLRTRVHKLAEAFHEIIFSQIKISAINALLTWLYLDGILALTGYHLPLTKTLVVLTFFFGLLPIIGNLITNTLIVIISMTHSVELGIVSLLFLMVIHKLEYFLNAKIIGSRIHARTWELLIAMLVMEALFGLPGVVAAPIYYAYLKNELKAAKLL